MKLVNAFGALALGIGLAACNAPDQTINSDEEFFDGLQVLNQVAADPASQLICRQVDADGEQRYYLQATHPTQTDRHFVLSRSQYGRFDILALRRVGESHANGYTGRDLLDGGNSRAEAAYNALAQLADQSLQYECVTQSNDAPMSVAYAARQRALTPVE